MSRMAIAKEEPDPRAAQDFPAAPAVGNVKKEPDPSAEPDPQYDPTPHVVAQQSTAKRQRTAGKELRELLQEKKWDEVIDMIRRLRQRNGTARIPEMDVTSELGFTPLVYAVQSGAPSRVVKRLVDEYTVTERCNDILPLHWACASKTLTCGTIEKILDLYPKAILENSAVGSPFQIILQKKPSLKLFDTMVEVWAGQTGTDEDESWKTILSVPDPDADGMLMLPLHVAIQYRAPTDLILKMIEKYPESVTKEIEENGLPPLHWAAFHGCSFEVLKSLLEHASGMIGSKRGEEENTPLHLLFHSDHSDRWIKNEEGMMPPHEMVRYLIKTHAYHLESLNGRAKKGLQYSPGNRAKALVCTTENIPKYTVLEYALQLKEKLFPACSDELRTLLEEFEHFRHKDWYPLNWKMEAP